MTRWFKIMSVLAGAALLLIASAGGSYAHHAVLRFNLEEMTATANRIFVGRCLAVEETEEMIAQGILPVTRYTFEVERAIKGRLPRVVTFRQLGHPAKRALSKGGGMTVHGRAASPDSFLHGMSEYRRGDRVILFLIPDYMGGKVTYPVGLYQGAFFVSEMPSGEKLVRNSINNLGLFTAPYNGTKMKESDARIIFPASGDLSRIPDGESLARKRGALPLDQFINVVDQIVAAHGDEKGTIGGPRKGVIQQ
ncbi:MAG TPA: hypothetical protein VJH03_18555 [Blastocatellia bacterium]|nr:hypothetical protein [Blastocatellia bacterium]